MDEARAKILTPQKINETSSLQADIVRLLNKVPASDYSATIKKMPCLMSFDSNYKFSYLAFRPPPQNPPPVCALITFVEFDTTWKVYQGKIRILRHAIQRWVQRIDSNLSTMAVDLNSALPALILILSVWPAGPIIIPTQNGCYLGKLCKEGKTKWLELWTFTSSQELFNAPKEFRLRFFKEILNSPKRIIASNDLLKNQIFGTPLSEDSLSIVVEIFEDMQNLLNSSIWQKHLAARRQSGDNF